MRTVLFLGSLMLLSACGSKGPLVMPPPPAKPPATAPAPQAPPAAIDDSTAKAQAK